MDSAKEDNKSTESEIHACDYPFSWQPRDQLKGIPKNMMEMISVQLKETKPEAEFPYEYLMLFVLQSYEYGHEGKIDEALEALEAGENKFAQCVPENVLENVSYRNLHSAFLHVIKATKAYLLLQRDNASAAAKIMTEIPTADDTKDKKAAFLILQSIFLSTYGSNGVEKAALSLLEAARVMPVDELLSLCHFFRGRYLVKLRHLGSLEKESFRNQEFHFTEATKLKNFNFYTLHLAEFYQECAEKNISLVNGMTGEDLFEKSLELYKKSANFAESEENPQKLFKCAKGFFLLPHQFRDTEYGKKLLDRGLEIAPDSIAGKYVTFYRDKTEMIESYLCSVEFFNQMWEVAPSGPLDMRILFKNHHSDLDAFFQKLENLPDDFEDGQRTLFKICHELLHFYIIAVKDVHAASKCAAQVSKMIEDNIEGKILSLGHAQILQILNDDSRISILDILADEIKIESLNSCRTANDKQYYNGLLDQLFTKGYFLSIRREDPPRNLREDLLRSRR